MKNRSQRHHLEQLHLTTSTFYKIFGIIIDDKLKWTNRISYIKNKIAKGMAFY